MRVCAWIDRWSEWDAVVRRDGASTFCHLAAWQGVMADALGQEPLYQVAVDEEGRWCGVLPLVRVRSRVFGHYLVSLPFLNDGGPVGSPEAQRALVDHAVTLARHLGTDLLELRARRPLPADLRVTYRKLTVLLDLPGTPAALWARFPSKLRSQIRRPLKEGMECRFGPDQLPAFYEVFARAMRDLGTPVLPRALFERMALAFRDLVVFGVVYAGRQPVAAGCGFVWRDEFEMTWAGAQREFRRAAPNMLLYWSFMERLISRGVRVFNFGRSSPGSGTHRFKLQWGGRDLPLPWCAWSPREVSATPTPDRGAYRWAAAVWRRLPLAVTNRVGPLLARSLP